MLKDIDDKDREPARQRATRKWRNHAIEKRLKEEASKPQPVKSKELEIADTISNKKLDGRGSLTKAQTKFAKESRMMMEGHAAKTLALYALSIRARRYRLLNEKLRRLEIREARRMAQQKRDLFA
jgi:hypothetical protein